MLAAPRAVHGFGLVMLYGGVSVWVLSLLSFLIFGQKDEKRRAAAGE